INSWRLFHFASDGTVSSDTCPIESPDSILTWSWLAISYYNQIHFPDVRKAAAISRFDEVLGSFACLWGATPDAGGSCQWVVADSIADLFTSYLVSRQKSFNYKTYAATTDCHGVDSFDPSGHCDYDTFQENGVKFSDWVNGWMEQPSPVQWKNVVEPGRVERMFRPSLRDVPSKVTPQLWRSGTPPSLVMPSMTRIQQGGLWEQDPVPDAAGPHLQLVKAPSRREEAA